MKGYSLPKIISLIYVVYTVIECSKLYSQCPNQQTTWHNIISVENNQYFSQLQKLEHLYYLRNTLIKCNQTQDSVYAEVLRRIGVYEFQVTKNYGAAIQNTNASVQINILAKKYGSKFLATKAYFNLAKFYDKLDMSNKALAYYDSTIALAKTFSDTTNLILYSKINKVIIHFNKGDYQKAVEESIDGMHYSLYKKDSSYFLAFLNQKGQSLYFENQLSEALNDVETIITAEKNQKDLFELATAIKTKAMIFKKNQKFSQANGLFIDAIKIRIKTNDYHQISLDYIDYGNFLLDSLHNQKEAKKNYLKTIEYAKKVDDSMVIALATINISEIYLDQKLYDDANNYCIKAFAYLKMPVGNNIFKNPTSEKLNSISNKELSVVIMNNKIEILLGLFLNNKNKNALTGCLQSCLVMDTLITKMRHLQTGNESKLYWRDYTRSFYNKAIEACYLANNAKLAFYFMEKSRAVLLNDKLNEIGAAAFLPAPESKKQEAYQLKIVEIEQKLSELNDASKIFQTTQLKLLNAKNDFEQYILSLETKYPEYYQYKYEDDVPPLQDIQQHLAKNNQSFVYYFLGDSAIYSLAITADNTKFIRIENNDFNKDDLNAFIKLSSNKQALNSHYSSFIALSNSIYKKLFQPLGLQKGRIIICTDNVVIPFDALCTDTTGKNFLLNDYSFSYVYSARYLMKHFNTTKPTGNFIGFAPVSFQHYLDVNDLKNAAESLKISALNYPDNKLFTHQNASRNNFFKYASSYSVVSIFSHARADTTDNEPVLYMQDSLISLSELQYLSDPATQLVMLSACQTNVGRAATGEGIYSLARGFAAAGIPSVSATLWKADEASIYSISEKFNQYLSKGMNKDEALQKAKIDFIQNNNNNEKLLPYYWANMILIGNTDAIQLKTTNTNYLWLILSSIAVAAIVIIFLARRNKLSKLKI